jgi:glycosyltransferase involved in cell wall biosynthesis
VATDVADNALILDDTSGGTVVPVDADEALAERVCDLLADPRALRAAAAQARRTAVERFSVRRSVEAISTLYEETWARKVRGEPSASTGIRA